MKSMDLLKDPYFLASCLLLPTVLLIMDLFKKSKFVVDGRVRLNFYLAAASTNINADTMDRLLSSLALLRVWALKSRKSWHRKAQMSSS